MVVGRAVQLSDAPEASTPNGNWPAEQLAPLAARAVAVEAFPVTAPVRLPKKVPVVVPGSVGFVGIESVHDPLPVIGDVPVTVIWLDVPARPTEVTVPEPPPPLIAVHVLVAEQ